jgi:hypothetical protein
MSAPQSAALRAAGDLEQQYGRESMWDLVTIQGAARRYVGGAKVTQRTLNGLLRDCKLIRDGGRYGLGESGRVCLREGL